MDKGGTGETWRFAARAGTRPREPAHHEGGADYAGAMFVALKEPLGARSFTVGVEERRPLVPMIETEFRGIMEDCGQTLDSASARTAGQVVEAARMFFEGRCMEEGGTSAGIERGGIKPDESRSRLAERLAYIERR
jgi:hypothetical protein